MRLSTPDKVLAALGQMPSPGGTARAELALDRSFHLLESILETKLARVAQVDTYDVYREYGLPLRLRLTNRFVAMDEDIKPIVYSKPAGLPLEGLSLDYLVPEDQYTIDPVEGVLSMHAYGLHSGRNSLAIQYRTGFTPNVASPELLDVPFELENLAIQGAVLELNTAPSTAANRKEKTVVNVAAMLYGYLSVEARRFDRPRMTVQYPSVSVVYG